MGKIVSTAFGLLLTVLGAVWALQGLGYLKGSSMTGSSLWAVLGPITAAFGIALLIVAIRGPRRKR